MNKINSCLDALIIGCGKIAGGYDEALVSYSGKTSVLSHAGGYAAHRGFRVVACVDPDPLRRREFMERWSVPAGFASLEDCLNAGIETHVASVCSPTIHHVEHLEKLLNTSCRAVLCEKPLTEELAKARRLAEAYEKAGKPLLVNFRRRFLPSVQTLRKRVADGVFGKPLWVVGWYGKGLRHNGGHMLDLLSFFLGPLRPVQAFASIHDYFDDDPTMNAFLVTQDGAQVHLIGSDCRAHHLFELSMGFEKGVVNLEEDGNVARERPVAVNPLYPHHHYVGRGETYTMDLERALYWAIDALWQAVTDPTAPRCSDANSALLSQELTEALKTMTRDKVEVAL